MTDPDPDPDLTYVCGACSLVLPAGLPCPTCRPDGLAVTGCTVCRWDETVASTIPALVHAERFHYDDTGHSRYWRIIGARSA